MLVADRTFKLKAMIRQNNEMRSYFPLKDIWPAFSIKHLTQTDTKWQLIANQFILQHKKGLKSKLMMILCYIEGEMVK